MCKKMLTLHDIRSCLFCFCFCFFGGFFLVLFLFFRQQINRELKMECAGFLKLLQDLLL